MKVEPTNERLDAPVLIAVIMLRSPEVRPPPAASTADIVICDSKPIERFDVFPLFVFVVSVVWYLPRRTLRGGLTSRPGPGRVGWVELCLMDRIPRRLLIQAQPKYFVQPKNLKFLISNTNII